MAAIILAAGESRRWGVDNKLLAEIGGAAMIRKTAEAVLASAIRPVVVATGHDSATIQAALAGLPVSFRHADRFAAGMSESLKAGIDAVPAGCSAALVCLGDMPFIRPRTFDRLAAAWNPAGGLAALIPVFGGERGNPVLLGRTLFAAIAALSGDKGARSLLGSIPGRIGEIAVDDPGILRDVDRPDMLAGAAGR